jgi:hypothetical protein
VDSPLLTEDEWVFQIDQNIDLEKLERVKNLIGHVSEDLLPAEAKTFLMRQLS